MTDSRENPPGLEALRKDYPDMAMFLGGFQAEVFHAASRLVVSPGVSLDEPLIRAVKERHVEIVGDVELFARAVKAAGSRNYRIEWQEHSYNLAGRYGAYGRYQGGCGWQPWAARA